MKQRDGAAQDGVKVLLVLANSFMDNLIPLGTSILSACLKEAGHKVKLFDTTFYKTREETGDDARVETLQVKHTNLADFGVYPKNTDMVSDFKGMVSEYQPDLIGVSAVETTYLIGLQLLEAVRDSGIPTIMGGVHITFSPEEVIKERAVDMICVGEGELAMVELANRIQHKRDYTDIPNLWVKARGKLHTNPVGPLVDLSELPEQDWAIYEKERFYKPMGGKVYIAGVMEVNRGCPYSCSFCCNKGLQDLYRGLGHYYRERDMDNAMREVKAKKEQYNLQYLYIVAENFLQMSDERFSKFLQHYKDIRLPFWIETRPESVTKDRAQRLKEAGCEGMSIGIEHGNELFRKGVLNRRVTNEAMVKAFQVARMAGIRSCANNIIGFPGETRALVFETIELSRQLQPDNIIVNIYSPYRGTRLRDACVRMGYMDEYGLAGDYRSDITLKMPQLTSTHIKGLHRTFAMYVRFPKEMWPEIEKSETDDEVFKQLRQIYLERYV